VRSSPSHATRPVRLNLTRFDAVEQDLLPLVDVRPHVARGTGPRPRVKSAFERGRFSPRGAGAPPAARRWPPRSATTWAAGRTSRPDLYPRVFQHLVDPREPARAGSSGASSACLLLIGDGAVNARAEQLRDPPLAFTVCAARWIMVARFALRTFRRLRGAGALPRPPAGPRCSRPRSQRVRAIACASLRDRAEEGSRVAFERCGERIPRRCRRRGARAVAGGGAVSDRGSWDGHTCHPSWASRRCAAPRVGRGRALSRRTPLRTRRSVRRRWRHVRGPRPPLPAFRLNPELTPTSECRPIALPAPRHAPPRSVASSIAVAAREHASHVGHRPARGRTACHPLQRLLRSRPVRSSGTSCSLDRLSRLPPSVMKETRGRPQEGARLGECARHRAYDLAADAEGTVASAAADVDGALTNTASNPPERCRSSTSLS
jgi:hypothetical protein